MTMIKLTKNWNISPQKSYQLDQFSTIIFLAQSFSDTIKANLFCVLSGHFIRILQLLSQIRIGCHLHLWHHNCALPTCVETAHLLFSTKLYMYMYKCNSNSKSSKQATCIKKTGTNRQRTTCKTAHCNMQTKFLGTILSQFNNGTKEALHNNKRGELSMLIQIRNLIVSSIHSQTVDN